MLPEEIQAAGLGEIESGLIEARPLLATEAVFGALIDKNLGPRLGGANLINVGQRNAVILGAEMQLNRAVGGRGAGRGDAAAIPTRRWCRPSNSR
jgi:hypothetical protein